MASVEVLEDCFWLSAETLTNGVSSSVSTSH